MNIFESNIKNIYGHAGIIWLQNLPTLIDDLSSKLDLYDLKPVNNLSYNYVMTGLQAENAIILKIGLDTASLAREAQTLNYFSGHGAVKVLAAAEGILLLQRAMPGDSLKSYFPNDDAKAVEITSQVIKKLQLAHLPSSSKLLHINEWLSALDKDYNQQIAPYLTKVRYLRDQLLQTNAKDYLLHGDLHHDNILRHDKKWLVIDPKGVIGDAAYEVTSFIFNPIDGLLQQPNAIAIINDRIKQFAISLQLDRLRIINWCLVQAVLSWIWNLEDNLDTNFYRQLTIIFASMC